jgi:hypothetical protein
VGRTRLPASSLKLGHYPPSELRDIHHIYSYIGRFNRHAAEALAQSPGGRPWRADPGTPTTVEDVHRGRACFETHPSSSLGQALRALLRACESFVLMPADPLYVVSKCLYDVEIGTTLIENQKIRTLSA